MNMPHLDCLVWRCIAVPLLLGTIAGYPNVSGAADHCSRLRDEGIRLFDNGDAKRALPRLEEAQRCRPQARTLLYIGLSQRELGQPAGALASFRRARDQAAGDHETAELAERGIREIEGPAQTAESAQMVSTLRDSATPAQVWAGDTERARRKQRLAGWILLGGGLFSVALGGVLLGIDGIPSCSKEPRDVRCPQVLNTWPAGTTMMVVGGSALVASTVLLIQSRPPTLPPLSSVQTEPALGLAFDF